MSTDSNSGEGVPGHGANRSGSASTLLLVGAGGHGRVVAEAALRTQRWARLLACDADPARSIGYLLPDVPLLPQGEARAIVAGVHLSIGDNCARERESGAWGEAPLVSVLHPGALVSNFAQIDPGCFVAAGAVLGPMAHLGPGGIVNHGAVLDHDVQVGRFCHIAPNATLGGAVRLGDRVLIGAGAVVLPGLAIADDVVVGAGAVVCRDLTEPGTYVGVPARRIT